MKPMQGKIFVRISHKQREDIFKHTFMGANGKETFLFLPDIGESTLKKRVFYVQTGVVESVGVGCNNITIGDIAILDYTVADDKTRFIYSDDEGDVYWVNAHTTYHDTTMVAFANRKSPKDQIVYTSGDIDELSPLLGLVRNGELIPIQPYVFLEHKDNVFQKSTLVGITYEETQQVFVRKVLCAPQESLVTPKVKNGDNVLVRDFDIFMVTLDGRKLDCIVDTDILADVDGEEIKISNRKGFPYTPKGERKALLN